MVKARIITQTLRDPPRLDAIVSRFYRAEATDFEVAPDGTLFLVQLLEGSSDPPMLMLVNWPARLGLRQ